MLVDMNSVTRCMVVSSASLFSSPHKFAWSGRTKLLRFVSVLFVAAQANRYTASVTGAGSSLKVTGGCLSFERHLRLSQSPLAYTVQSFLHSIGLDLESDA
jgi:hypothetical protein